MNLRAALLRSALAGAATGGRSFAGVAALASTADTASRTQPDRGLAKGRVVIGLLALGELAADKLPNAPSRLAPPGIGGRIGLSALCGVALARREFAVAPAVQTRGRCRREQVAVALCLVTSVATAVGTSRLGVRWRRGADAGTAEAWLRAVAEDAAVAGAATLAVRRSG